MKLTVLVDNHTLIDRYLLGEPAVCYLIEDGDQRFLFDLGYGDAFLRNARVLDIDVLTAEAVILSHGHIDHTGGLDPLSKRVLEAQLEGTAPDQHGRMRLIAHPEVFTPRTAAEGSISVGSVMGLGQAGAVCAAELSAAPRWLSERLLFLGEIERRFDYEGQSPIGVRHTAEGDVPDLLPDDTALAYVAENGLVIITGCSHAGICNIIEQARRITGVERVLDVIGGFHLLEPPRRQLEETASYLGWLGLEALHACHCTDLASKLALAQKAPLRETGCGLVLQYD